MKPTTPLWAATFVAACASISPPTSVEIEQLADARSLLASEPDRAADLADAMLAANPDLRAARLLSAEGSLRMARDPRFSRTQLHLLDAVRNFQIGLADTAPADFPAEQRMLAECHYELGEFEAGSAAAALSATGFAERKGGENRGEYGTSRLIGARCDYRRFVAARQNELDGGEPGKNGVVPVGAEAAELAARAASGFAEARLDHPGEATTQLANIHMWLGQPSEVINEYERGLMASPQETVIHDAYIRWMTEAGQQNALVGAYRRFVRERPDTPMLRWFLGRAIFSRADQLRREGNFQGAIAVYEQSRQTFGEYLAMMPQHAGASHQWQALCDLSTTRCAVDTGDLDHAQQCLLRAGATAPLATTYVDGQPQLADSYGNHFTAAAFAIHRALTQSPENALQRTLGFNEALLQQYPDRWGFVYNNAALAARDLGVQVATGDDEQAAKELWERSYRYYEKAIELAPEDARIVNDCGLMLIYHLDRDFDRARELFDRAIEIGTRQLSTMPDDADARERELLEEAVGDAYQNIAILLREHRGAAFADYRPFCEQAVKYFPYQRREAAALLRNEGRTALGSTARATADAGATGQQDPQGGAADALQKARPEIEAKADAGDFDTALNLLDKLSTTCKEHAPYHLLKGEMTWRLANQARDSGRRGTELFYQDAVRALQRAVELDAEPVAPRQMLAQAQFDAGDTEAASETLSSLLLHLQSQGGGKAEQLLAVHTLRANSAARAYAQKKGNGEDDPELLTAARTSLRWLEQKSALDAGLLQLWSTTEQWAGAPAEAVNVYVRASSRAPEDLGLLDLVVSTAAGQQQLPIAVEALKTRQDAGSRWYLGKACYLLASQERQDGNAAQALTTLDDAQRYFTESMQQNASYRDSCEQWIAMCLGKKGNIALQSADIDNAQKWLLESMRLRPDRIFEDLGLLETTKGGVLGLVDHHYRKNDLQKVEAISRAAAEAANSDVDLLNNAGLFARDYGNALERDGKIEAAQEMYEQSYKAYRRAQQLDPTSVRLRNDAALIAIYYLERDWDEMRQLLEGAIADGDRMLAESPPENEDQKQQLEEAVGDCYENLALWHLKHSKDGQAAKAAAEKSQEYHPGKGRPGARRHLQAAERLLQGK